MPMSHELRIASLAAYENPLSATARIMKVDNGAGSLNGSISMPKIVAANVRGMNKKANSVSRVMLWASAIDRRLSRSAMLDVKDDEAL